jgi:predicted lipoprotein with Yx(FWY)xxD motif
MPSAVHGLGKVLVDGQGMTLYVFAPDKHSGHSTCYGTCAQAWPPLLLPAGVSKTPGGSGVQAHLLGTTTRKDGTVEVTYKKWPLYTWVGDVTPGQATGQDINSTGGKWYVITPKGEIITKKP